MKMRSTKQVAMFELPGKVKDIVLCVGNCFLWDAIFVFVLYSTGIFETVEILMLISYMY